MKKLLLIVLLALVGLAAACGAEKAKSAGPQTYFEGQALAGCFAEEGRLYLPVSSLAQAMGMEEEWDEAGQTLGLFYEGGPRLDIHIDGWEAERTWFAEEPGQEDFVCTYGLNDTPLLRNGEVCASVETLAFLLNLNLDKLDEDAYYLHRFILVWEDRDNNQVYLLDLLGGTLQVRQPGQTLAEAKLLGRVEDGSLQDLNQLGSWGEAHMSVERTAAGNYLLDCWAATLPDWEQAVSVRYVLDGRQPGIVYVASLQGMHNGLDSAPKWLRQGEDLWLNSETGIWRLRDCAPLEGEFIDAAAIQAAVLGRDQTRPVYCYWVGGQGLLLLGDKRDYVLYDWESQTGWAITPLVLRAEVKAQAEEKLRQAAPEQFAGQAQLAEFWQRLGRAAELPKGTSYPKLALFQYKDEILYFSLELVCYMPDGVSYSIHSNNIPLPLAEIIKE